MVEEKYSVVLLKETKIKNPKVINDKNKRFEEVIVLCTLPNDFFENNSYKDILKHFKEKIPTLKYNNCYGELICQKVVAVIDSFNIISNIKFNEFEEVYSRHFIEEENTTLNNIIEKYYSEFSFMKQKN